MAENEQKKAVRTRSVLAVVLLALTVLLLGSSRLGDSIASRRETAEQARREWQSAAVRLAGRESPDAEGRAWRELAAARPELLLQAFHSSLRLQPEP